MRLICSNSTARAFWLSRCRASARPPAPSGNAEKLAESLRRYAQDRGYQGGGRSAFRGHRSVQGRSFRRPYENGQARDAHAGADEPRQQERRHGGRHGRPVRAGARAGRPTTATTCRMYGVNASVPKTLVRYLVAYEADRAPAASCADVLQRCARHARYRPSCCRPRTAKSARKPRIWSARTSCTTSSCIICCASAIRRARSSVVAQHAFAGVYDDATIKKWLTTFMRRFFTQQFKRSCLPDGPKVGIGHAFAARRLAYAVGRSSPRCG